MRCYEMECSNQDASVCAYVDAEGRHCLSSWCPEHSRVINGETFCRRHSAVMEAISLGEMGPERVPRLDDRSASLTRWVSADLDADVRRVLATRADSDSEIVFEPLHLNSEQSPRWVRGWVLLKSGGVDCRVSVEVAEQGDPAVTVKVNGVDVARGVPPWITHRMGHEWVEPTVDAEERAVFYAKLVLAIEGALTT